MKAPTGSLIAISFVMLHSLYVDASAQVQFSKYENTDHKIGIQYPSDWSLSEDNLLPYQLARFSAPKLVSTTIYVPAELVIAVRPLYSLGMSVDQFISQFFNETYSEPTDYNIINTSKSTLYGTDEARKITMYEYVGNNTSKVMQVFGVENDTAYMIKYLAEPDQFSNYLPAAESMIGSISISNLATEGIQQHPSSISALEEQEQPQDKPPSLPSVVSQINNTQDKNESTEISSNDYLSYQSPALGIRILYLPNWQIEEEEGEQVTFIKEKDEVRFLVDVEDLDSSDITLTEYVGDKITEKREERKDFNLLESTTVIISGEVQGHKLVYTFVKGDRDEPRYGEINKILRIYAIEDDKVYTIAYVAESDKYSTYLPVVQQMIDSFEIGGLNLN